MHSHTPHTGVWSRYSVGTCQAVGITVVVTSIVFVLIGVDVTKLTNPRYMYWDCEAEVSMTPSPILSIRWASDGMYCYACVWLILILNLQLKQY